MKKNKNEILLLVVIIFFALLGLYFYKESKTVVTTTEIPYNEKGNATYKVYLNDKKYYNKDFLDENMQYISSIIDYIDINFNYNANYAGVSNYKLKKKINADIKIVDTNDNNKVIYSKKEVLKDILEDAATIAVNDDIKIDYKKYNGLANEFKTNYGISAKCVLTISYNLTYTSIKSGISQNRSFFVEIPLSEQMININKSTPISNSSVYLGETTESMFNKIMFVLSIVFEIIALIVIIILILEVRHRIAKESKYERFIAKTLREYDSYITESKTIEEINKPVIKVQSFKELLDVRNNVEKTIVYTKIDENTSRFEIIDDEIYQYIVRREEMDK